MFVALIVVLCQVKWPCFTNWISIMYTRLLFYLQMMLLSGFVLYACNIPAPFDDSQSQVEDCLETQLVNFSEPMYRPKAIYVLVDNSGSYQIYRKQSDPLLKTVLREVLSPGDQIAVGLVGVGAADATINSEIVPKAKPINLRKAPEYLPVPSPTPLTEDEALISSLVQKHERIKKDVEAENDKQKCEYYHAISQWNEITQKDFSDWETQQNASTEQVLDSIISRVPTLPGNEDKTDIYSGLYTASDFLAHAKRDGYEHRILLVFSDMHHQASSGTSSTWVKNIDLEGVTVVAAMVPYDADSHVAENDITEFDVKREFWLQWLSDKKVKRGEFLSIPLSSVEKLVAIIRSEE